MASHGKNYPDRARDPRRQVSRFFDYVPQVREQAPTLTPEQERRYMEQDAFDAMMREAPGSGGVSQLGDTFLKQDNK